jgi:hypothetical protein
MRVISIITTVGALAALVAATASAGGGSSCHSNRTYEDAVKAGQLPAIVAALHGGATPSSVSLLSCGTTNR